MRCQSCVELKIEKLLKLYKTDKKKLFLNHHNIQQEVLKDDRLKDVKEFFEKANKKIDDLINHNH